MRVKFETGIADEQTWFWRGRGQESKLRIAEYWCRRHGIRLMKALVLPVAMYGCESWSLRRNEETRLDAFEKKGLRKILRISC